MNLKNVEKKEKNTAVLTIEVGAEEFDAAVEKVYRKNKSVISLPGFRKGKAPRKLVEQMYGADVFYEDAVNDLYPVALTDAVKESGLDMVGYPSVEMQNLGKDGFTFTATIALRPVPVLGQYKGIEAPKAEVTITAEDIDGEMKPLITRATRQVVVERPAQKGDTVVIDFEGFKDGVAFEGGKAEHYSLVLGSGSFIPGFEDQLIGHEAGEEFDVNVTFPEEYQAKELAGKPAVFKIKLHEVKTKELPALDDEFAKDVSEYDTLDELKASIRKGMEEQNEKQAALAVENDLVDQVIATIEGDIPEAMYEARMDEAVRDFEYRLAQQGLKLDMYLQYMGQTMESFRASFREQAEKQVKIRLALEAVAAAEQIVASDEELEAELQRVADNYKMELAKVKELVNADEVKKDLAVNKAIDFIRDHAEITEEKVAKEG